MFYIIEIVLCTAVLCLGTNYLTLPSKARWYAVHCAVNALVSVWTIPYVYIMLTESTPDYTDGSPLPSIFVMSLHLYHTISYTLNRGDIVHHTVMLLVLTIPLCNPEFLGFSNYSLFFLCGLPGGIDYYLMYLVETKGFSRLKEKHYNIYLNTWLRSLGILYGVFRCYNDYLMGYINGYIAAPVILALTWNAQFYTSEVAQSYGYHCAMMQVKAQHK